MGITPQGRSIQAMYRDYRDGKFIVNRRYQRKLVWSLEEKRKLIDSVLRNYPVPLVLLAELRTGSHSGKWEIIDGMQRLNAVFSFIEHGFSVDGKYFDLEQFARAKQACDDGVFVPQVLPMLLEKEKCSDILDYQLAITVYPAATEVEITEVFGRINAQGRQLSPQEQRQAGVSNRVSTIVREVASEIRGDVSTEILDLANMPEISIEHEQSPHGYGINAEDTIWCKQGILTRKQLRDSEDEQIVLDLIASVVLQNPVAASRETFDKFYDRDHAESASLESALIAYGEDRMKSEILGTISVLEDMIAKVSSQRQFLRNTIRPGINNPIKGPFYAFFMALFNLVVVQEKSPGDHQKIFESISGIGGTLTPASHYTTSEDRTRNINMIKGLIQDHFVDKRPPAFTSGAGLSLQVENALRRSQIETPRYETKQGLLDLGTTREWNEALEKRIIETACGIANLADEGAIFIGVADSASDAQRVHSLDGIEPIKIGNRFVVGVDREARILGIDVERYLRRIVDAVRASGLSDPLKTQLLGCVDSIDYRGLSIIRLSIPRQSETSFVDSLCFTREGSETKEVKGPQILAVEKRFL